MSRKFRSNHNIQYRFNHSKPPHKKFNTNSLIINHPKSRNHAYTSIIRSVHRTQQSLDPKSHSRGLHHVTAVLRSEARAHQLPERNRECEAHLRGWPLITPSLAVYFSRELSELSPAAQRVSCSCSLSPSNSLCVPRARADDAVIHTRAPQRQQQRPFRTLERSGAPRQLQVFGGCERVYARCDAGRLGDWDFSGGMEVQSLVGLVHGFYVLLPCECMSLFYGGKLSLY